MNILLLILFVGFDLLIHRIMVIYEVRKNPDLFKDIEIPKSWKKYISVFLLSICIFFIGNVVNAKGTMFIGNGVVLNQCTGTTCRYDSAGTTNLRFIGDNTNFEVDHKYTFKLNFSATTSMASPTLTDCGLNINGAYVSPESRNSGRVNYECNQDYSRCDSSYVSTIVYTIPNSLTSVPYFIQCDMTPTATKYTYTNFTMSISDSNGSVIQAIDNNTDRMIEVNNYNANQNNANRDRNTNKITDKIQDFMDAVGSGINNIISGLTTLGQNIVSGISSAINTAKNAIISAMDGLQMGINAVISAIGDIVSPIVNAIGNGVSAIVNKIGELIGLQEVCNVFYSVSGEDVTINTTNSSNNLFINKSLDPNGVLTNNNSFNTTDFIPINSGSGVVSLQHNYTGNPSYYYCLFKPDKSLYRCSNISVGSTDFNSQELFNSTNSTGLFYVRFSYRNLPTNTYRIVADCHKSGIVGLFHSFTQFIRNLFSIKTDDLWNQLENINLISETPVTDLIMMPVDFLQAINVQLSGEEVSLNRGRIETKKVSRSGSSGGGCHTYTIPFDFTGGNNTLTFPCFHLQNYLGNDVINIIDMIFCGFIALALAHMVVSSFENLSSLEDGFDQLYGWYDYQIKSRK